jgi:hypothetical protein
MHGFHRSLKVDCGRFIHVYRGILGILVLLFLTGCAATRPHTVARAPVHEVAVPDVADRTPAPPPRELANVESFLRASMEPWGDTPHLFGGTAIAGADCSGFIVSLYREAFGISLPRTTRDQANAGHSIRRDELEAGDLVFFRPDRVVNHVGIYLSDGRFAHISTSRGFIISHLDEPYWQRRYAAARRVLDSYTIDSTLLAWNVADPMPGFHSQGMASDGMAVVDGSGTEKSGGEKTAGQKSSAGISGNELPAVEKPSTTPTEQASSQTRRRGGW